MASKSHPTVFSRSVPSSEYHAYDTLAPLLRQPRERKGAVIFNSIRIDRNPMYGRMRYELLREIEMVLTQDRTVPDRGISAWPLNRSQSHYVIEVSCRPLMLVQN